MERFVCNSGIDNQQIPEALVTELGIKTPEDLHLQPETIALISQKMNHRVWVRLPFCNTLFSEMLRAEPALTLTGARIKEPPYLKIDQLPAAPDWNTPRFAAMMQATEILTSRGDLVAYNVDGPFTLLCTLLPMSRVFSALRKPAGDLLLQKAEDWISMYADQAVKNGAALLSFADPVATIDILGERMFSSVCVPSLIRLLKRLQAEHPDIPIHLCGKLTQCLLDTNVCQTKLWLADNCETYGQALAACRDCRQGGIIGHFCLNLLDSKRPYLTIINFTGKEDK